MESDIRMDTQAKNHQNKRLTAGFVPPVRGAGEATNLGEAGARRGLIGAATARSGNQIKMTASHENHKHSTTPNLQYRGIISRKFITQQTLPDK